jgi:hypothetical protein
MDHTKILKAHQYFAGPILSMSGCVSVAFLSPPAICRMSHGQSDHKPRHAGRALFICVSYLGSSEDIDGVNQERFAPISSHMPWMRMNWVLKLLAAAAAALLVALRGDLMGDGTASNLDPSPPSHKNSGPFGCTCMCSCAFTACCARWESPAGTFMIGPSGRRTTY